MVNRKRFDLKSGDEIPMEEQDAVARNMSKLVTILIGIFLSIIGVFIHLIVLNTLIVGFFFLLPALDVFYYKQRLSMSSKVLLVLGLALTILSFIYPRWFLDLMYFLMRIDLDPWVRSIN